jgi:hypothetical protein
MVADRHISRKILRECLTLGGGGVTLHAEEVPP